MRLTYLYHSGYMLETEHCFVIFDYFLDGDAQERSLRSARAVVPSLSVETQEPYILKRHYQRVMSEPQTNVPGVVMQVIEKMCEHQKPCYFIASHFHADHFQPFILKFLDKVKDMRERACVDNKKDYLPEVYVVLSYDIYRARKKILRDYMQELIFLEKGERIELPHLTIEGFGSTDVGLSLGVLVDGLKIFHAGDLNYWHWQHESTKQELESATKLFHDEMRSLQALLSSDAQIASIEAASLNVGKAHLLELENFASCDDLEHENHQVLCDKPSLFASGFDVVLYPCDPRLKTNVLCGALSFIENFKSALLVPMHMWERPNEVISIFTKDPKTCHLELLSGTIDDDLDVLKLIKSDPEVFKIWVPLLSGDYCDFQKGETKAP